MGKGAARFGEEPGSLSVWLPEGGRAMKTLFADACYWIALLNPKEGLHAKAQAVSKELGPCRIVTSEMVLVELLNGLSGYGSKMREKAEQTVKQLSENPNVEVVPQTSSQFRAALERYATRKDKEWGVTDCASFIVMEGKNLSEALTYDHHFEQAGFTLLLKETP
jgi:predicted nucleic acid-binding protein